MTNTIYAIGLSIISILFNCSCRNSSPRINEQEKGLIENSNLKEALKPQESNERFFSTFNDLELVSPNILDSLREDGYIIYKSFDELTLQGINLLMDSIDVRYPFIGLNKRKNEIELLVFLDKKQAFKRVITKSRHAYIETVIDSSFTDAYKEKHRKEVITIDTDIYHIYRIYRKGNKTTISFTQDSTEPNSPSNGGSIKFDYGDIIRTYLLDYSIKDANQIDLLITEQEIRNNKWEKSYNFSEYIKLRFKDKIKIMPFSSETNYVKDEGTKTYYLPGNMDFYIDYYYELGIE